MLNASSNVNFSNKEIKINNSNFFLKDNIGEIITIIKIDKANLFFDDQKKLNILKLKGSIFGVPFTFDFKSKNDSIINKMINFKAKSLKLDILNEFTVEDKNSTRGKNIILFLNSTFKTKYDVKEKLIRFTSDNSKYNSSKIDYTGTLSINPFDLDLNIDLGNYKISKLFSFNSFFKELIKSEMFFNDNLSLDASILANTNSRDEIFQSTEINLSFINGKINLNETIFTNKKIGFLTLDNSDLFLKDNILILNTDLSITINDSERLFSTLNTKKSSRKQIKNIFINLDFNFLNGHIKFNKIKINNNEVNDQFLNLLDEFNDGSSNNLVKSRLLINRLLEAYDG